MSEHNKLYKLLRLRRRIDRKILLHQKWPAQYSLRNRIEILLRSQRLNCLVIKDKQLYELLNKKIEKFAQRNKLIIPCAAFHIESIKSCRLVPEWFKVLDGYGKRLTSFGAKLIVQGSYADSKITNYSDIDLVILYKPFNPEVLKIKKEIEIFLLSIDPLQHHGVFMIDITTFGFYWQMDLPVEVLKKAKYFGASETTLTITGVLEENIGSQKAVESILTVIINFLDKDFNQTGLWEWKFFLSDVLLLPTLILGSKGKYIYKRDSFLVAKEMFSKEAWYCIEKATSIRDAWPAAENLQKYTSVRNTVSEKPVREAIKTVDLPNISVEKNSVFKDSLRLLVKETESLISND